MSAQSEVNVPLMMSMDSEPESDSIESIPLETYGRSSLAKNGISRAERTDTSVSNTRCGCCSRRTVSLALTLSLILNLVLLISLLVSRGHGNGNALRVHCSSQNFTASGQQVSQVGESQGLPTRPSSSTSHTTTTTTTPSSPNTHTSPTPHGKHRSCLMTSSTTCGKDPERVQAPKDVGYVNVFQDLTRAEISAVVNYLLGQSSLNLHLGLGYYRSNIFGVELYVPAKETVLKFLDLSMEQPPREALVTVVPNEEGGSHATRVVRQYVVGPLPRPSHHRLNPRMPKAVPESRLTLSGFQEAYMHLLQEIRRSMGVEALLRESFGVTPADCAESPADHSQRPCLTMMGQKISFGLVNSTSFIFTSYYNAEFLTIHPLPFQVIVSVTPRGTYAVRSVYYADSVFSSLPELVRRYNQGMIPKVRKRYPQNAPGESSVRGSMNLRGAPSPATPHPPPRQYEPKGPRFSIEDQHVKYLEWSFNVRVSVESGPQVWDVRWSGERIVYELSLQEIAVLYAGANPASMFAHLSDSAFGLGDNAKPLVPGVDCPDHAHFLSIWILEAGRESGSHAKEATHAICVFEQNSGVPLRRHSSQGSEQTYGGLMDHHLVVRSIIVEFNYDYILDFVFHANGAMETRVYATGYIMAQWFHHGEDPFGFQVLEDVAGSVHHHLFHFKVDLDVGGVSNRYETLDFDVDDRDWPWLSTLKPSATSSSSSSSSSPPSSSSRSFQQISFKHHLRKTEKDAVYHYNFDKPKYHVFYNEEKKNRLGNVRAYRLETRGFSKQLLPSAHPALRSRKWADYCMAVTERKEEEMKSSSVFSMYDADDPVVNFQDFLADDGSIVDKDLVSWVTVGMHHIPHTEDLPNTPTLGTEASLLLLPFNYFPECPSVRSRDAVRAEKKRSSSPSQNGRGAAVVTHFQTYGAESDFSCLPPVYGWLKASNAHQSYP